MRKRMHFLIPVMFLISIDQMVKVVISSFLMTCDFDIIGSFMRFHPTLNTHLSWGGNYIQILSNPFVVIALNVIILFVFISGYLLYKQKQEITSLSVKIIMNFGLAGCLCSLIDKVIWGGSLDFIQMPFFIFDLKDCYLSVFICVFLIIGTIYRKEISLQEYIDFIILGIKNIE